MNLEEAVCLVVADRRRGDPTLATTEALYQAWQAVNRSSLRRDEVPPNATPDEVASIDEWNRTVTAYEVVLDQLNTPPTRCDLLVLVGMLSAEGVTTLSPLQEYWCYVAERGELS